MEIRKIFKTETAHIVRNAASLRCRYNIHGHSYIFEVFIEGPVNEKTGMVIDFTELKWIGKFIDQFDHATVFWSEEKPEIIVFFEEQFERVVIMKKNPTAENMASLVHKYVTDHITTKDCYCSKVKVHETTTGCAIANNSNDNDRLI